MPKFEAEKVQTGLFWAIILSETGHVFCCVLPTIFSILSLLTGAGLVSAMPAGLLAFHHIMHKWEIPMISFSGAILAFGWLLYKISLKMDCHDTGCGHGPCAPKKRNASGVLKIASCLFILNTIVYLLFHAGHPDFVQ